MVEELTKSSAETVHILAAPVKKAKMQCLNCKKIKIQTQTNFCNYPKI